MWKSPASPSGIQQREAREKGFRPASLCHLLPRAHRVRPRRGLWVPLVGSPHLAGGAHRGDEAPSPQGPWGFGDPATLLQGCRVHCPHPPAGLMSRCVLRGKRSAETENKTPSVLHPVHRCPWDPATVDWPLPPHTPRDGVLGPAGRQGGTPLS